MERSVAVKKLGSILGKTLGYRVDPKAPTQDDRDAARSELVAARAEHEALKQKLEAHYRAILEANPEYQTLFAAKRAARERLDRLSSITMHYKITVGTSNGMFFHVRAQGDSWEQVIEKLATEKQVA